MWVVSKYITHILTRKEISMDMSLILVLLAMALWYGTKIEESGCGLFLILGLVLLASTVFYTGP